MTDNQSMGGRGPEPAPKVIQMEHLLRGRFCFFFFQQRGGGGDPSEHGHVQDEKRHIDP